MAITLKLCPFCGKPGEHKEDRGWHGVGCQTSRCPGFRFALQYRSEAQAAAAWNDRVPPEHVQRTPHACHAHGLALESGEFIPADQLAWLAAPVEVAR